MSGENDGMDVDENQSAVAAFNKQKREDAIYYVSTLFYCIVTAAKLDVRTLDMQNLDESDNIAGAMSTLHNFLREGNMGQEPEDKFKVKKAKLNGVASLVMGTELELYRNIGHKADCKNVCPIFNMMTSNKLIKNEARMGVTSMTQREQKRLVLDNSDYQLSIHLI